MPVYMDNNATTPLDPAVREAMTPYLGDAFGNASSSSHAYGWQAANAVKTAREQVATLLKCRASDVVFTSGATESNNLAILGLVKSLCDKKPHVITQATEHKAVLEVCEAAQDRGAEVTVLPVDNFGLIRLEDLEKAIRPNTVLISIMMANNEVGAIQSVADVAQICRRRQIVFHTDAAQSFGKYAFDLHELGADLLSLSGHKIYGPKGVGALIVRSINREFKLKPLMFGGEQECKLRPGTLNVAGIVGLGAACVAAQAAMREECQRLKEYQARVLEAVMKAGKGRLNGPPPGPNRLCNNLSFSFQGLLADDLALGLSGIAYSAGSACNSENPKPSHVLKAMGLEDALSRATIRLSMGRFTTSAEVDRLTAKLAAL